jgi:D-hydantoinase
MNATPFDLVLRGGTLVHEDGEENVDLYVREGKVAALVDTPSTFAAADEIDARGLHLLPGIIDAHTHFKTFSRHCDSFDSMTTSAAHGGVTTVIAHVMGMNASDLGLRQRVERFLGEAQSSAFTDFSLHAGLADEANALDDIPAVVEMGIRSFKLFMAYRGRGLMSDDGFFLAALREVSRFGALPLVHAELGDVADRLEAELRLAHPEPTPSVVAETRPSWIETEAVRRAIKLAAIASSKLYVVHVSHPDTLQVITAARARGQTVYGETCPQYMTLSLRDYARLGGPAKIAPPLRDRGATREMARQAVAGAIDIVASDHAPYTLSDKTIDLWDCPVGAPGTETLLALAWRALKACGGQPSTLVRLIGANPARVFGLYPRKGCLKVGSDADITLVDFSQSVTIDGSAQHNSSGYSVYDGMTSPLQVVGTILRGTRLLWNGVLSDTPAGILVSRS